MSISKPGGALGFIEAVLMLNGELLEGAPE